MTVPSPLSSSSLNSKPTVSKSKYPIAYVEVRVFSHATEDPEKVQMAVCNILPEQLTQELVFSKSTLTGHYGNPITLLEIKLEDRKLLPLMLKKIGSSLSALDKEALEEEFKLRLEKRSLFLRFDKQSAFLGNIKIGSNDPIRVKIHFKNKTPQEIESLCKEAGLLP